MTQQGLCVCVCKVPYNSVRYYDAAMCVCVCVSSALQ